MQKSIQSFRLQISYDQLVCRSRQAATTPCRHAAADRPGDLVAGELQDRRRRGLPQAAQAGKKINFN